MKAVRSTLTLPSRFYECGKQEDDDDKGGCEKFIIFGGPQKFELKQIQFIPDWNHTLLKENVLIKKN